MNKKMIASLMSIALVMSSTVYGATETNGELAMMTEQKVEEQPAKEEQLTEKQDEEEREVDDRRVITIDEAVEYGIKNSITLQQVKTQADIAKLVSDNSPNTRNDLVDANDQLDSAPYQLEAGQDKIYEGEAELESAWALFNQEKMPVDYPVSIGGNTIVIKKGMDFETIMTMYEPYLPLVGIDSVDSLKVMVKQKLDQSASQIESGKSELESKTREYYTSNAKFQSALSYAMSSVSSKLSTSTISALDPRPIGDLIIKMANTQDQVTSYSVNIYKNKIGLQIQNSYYEALKQQKLLEVKQKAVERGKMQYELADAAYQVGAKSKDDMIIAKTYYDSTLMSEELQRKDYNAALIELKKNMNMDLGEDIKLAEVEVSPDESFDLSKGLSSGRRARLEVKMANAQVDLYKYLKTALEESNYSTSSNQYREANLLQQKAEIEAKGALLQVESDIRTSYSTMMSMQKIAQKALELKEGAEETLEIAKVKYEVGFGYDNALLTSLNLESMSGTMVEVLAAEENLVNIEEKAIEAINGYNLSKLKYLNDIGVLPY